MRKIMRRFWRRLWSNCWFKHTGHRVCIYRDGQLFFECDECGLEIHQALPAQVPRIDYAVPGKGYVRPVTTSGKVVGFRRGTK